MPAMLDRAAHVCPASPCPPARLALLAALAALAAACGRKDQAADAAACADRAQRMSATLPDFAAELRVFHDATVTPPELPAGRRIVFAATAIVVNRDGAVSLEGNTLGADRAALREQLTARLARTVDIATPDLYVVAEAATPVRVLDEVLAAVPEGFELKLTGLGPALELTPYHRQLQEQPWARALDAELRTADPSSAAVELSRRMERALGTRCAPLTRVYGSVTTEEDKGSYIARETPIALRACQCAVAEPDVLEYLLLAVFGAYDRPQRWIPLVREHGDAAGTVADLAARG